MVDLVVVELVSFLVTGFVCLFVLNTLRESESKLVALGVFCVVSLVTYYVCIAVLLFTIANPEIVASETLDFGRRITVWIGNEGKHTTLEMAQVSPAGKIERRTTLAPIDKNRSSGTPRAVVSGGYLWVTWTGKNRVRLGRLKIGA